MAEDDEAQDLTPEEREFLEAGLRLGLDDRYALLGQSFPVISPDGRLLRLTKAQAVARGQELFKRVKDRLYQKICVEWNYCKKRKLPKYQNSEKLIAALLKIIAFKGAGAIAVLLILLGIGLDNFCRCR